MLHPSKILNCYVDGDVLREVKEEVKQELRVDLTKLKQEKAAVLSLLQDRLRRELEAPERNLNWRTGGKYDTSELAHAVPSYLALQQATPSEECL